MSGLFQHSTNDFILIQRGTLSYSDSLENFLADYKQSYMLPYGYNSRYYDGQEVHYLQLIGKGSAWDVNSITPQEIPWPEGESIINCLQDLVRAKEARDNAVKAAEAAEIETIRQRIEEASYKPSELVRYQNALLALEYSGLLDRLLTSTNQAAVQKLVLHLQVIYDDEHIKTSLGLIAKDMPEPLTAGEKLALNRILSKSEFDFTIEEALEG